MNPSAELRPSRLPILLLNAALILPPVFLYTVKTDSPVYFLIASGVLLFAFFRKNYLPVRDRPIIYSITAALVLTIFPDMLIVIDDSRYGIFDLLIRSNLAIPLMTYLAAFSCAFYPYPARRGITAACVIVALVFCGDRFNSARLTNQVLFFLDPLLQHYPQMYGVAAGWTVLAVLVYFLYPGQLEMPESKSIFLRLRPVLLGGYLMLLPLCALAAEKYYYGNDSLMRAVEYYILRISIRKMLSPPRSRRQTLSSSVDLNRPLPPEWRQPDTVLLRIKAKNTPGYLRYGAYELYRSGRWNVRKNQPGPISLSAERRIGLISYSTFTVPDGDRKKNSDGKIELYLAGLQTSGRIPLPGNMTAVDAVADSGELAENGLLTLKQWRSDGGCTFHTALSDRNSAWPGPAGPEKIRAYLDVPAELQSPLGKILAAILSKDQPADDSGTVARLLEHFDAFSYSLENVNIGKKRDPLLWFLEHSRTGHCEFFASAAVLLLRRAGIPARYVTGFVCEEKSPVADYYLVRNSHAHAWCEAYLKDRKQWVIVDAVPGRVQESFRKPPSGNPFPVWLDSVKQLFQQAFADVRRGYFARAVMDILVGIGRLLLRIIGTVPGVILSGILAFGLIFGLYRRRKLRIASSRMMLLSDSRRKLAAEFARFERGWSAAAGRARPESMALLEFYAADSVRELCRRYEQLRYGASEPGPEEIRNFSAMADQVLAVMQKSASRSPRD